MTNEQFPPTDRELVEDVARAALDVRRVRLRLQGFGASSRHSSALEVPLGVFDAAVERLAVFRGAQ